MVHPFVCLLRQKLTLQMISNTIATITVTMDVSNNNITSLIVIIGKMNKNNNKRKKRQERETRERDKRDKRETKETIETDREFGVYYQNWSLTPFSYPQRRGPLCC